MFPLHLRFAETYYSKSWRFYPVSVMFPERKFQFMFPSYLIRTFPLLFVSVMFLQRNFWYPCWIFAMKTNRSWFCAWFLLFWRNWNVRKLHFHINEILTMDFQNNYREKVCIWISNSDWWYGLQSNKINIITQHEIATLLFFISCVKNKFHVPLACFDAETAQSRLCS